MKHVGGIKAIITQVVHHEFVGGEVGQERGGGGGGESCVFVEDLVDSCEEMGFAAGVLHWFCGVEGK